MAKEGVGSISPRCPATLPCPYLDGKCGNLVSCSFQIFIFPCLYIQFLQLTRWDLDRVEELLPVLEDASTTSTVKQMSPRPQTNLFCQHQRQDSLDHPSLSTYYGRQSGSECVHYSDVNWPPYWKPGEDNILCSDHVLHCSLLWFLRAQVTWQASVMISESFHPTYFSLTYLFSWWFCSQNILKQ